MKRYLLLFFSLILCISSYAQLDNESSSRKIEAEDDKDKKGTSISKTPVELTPNKNENKINGLTVPETASVSLPKKEFSMFNDDKFANPGELYEKRISRQEKQVKKDLEKEGLYQAEVFTDKYLGDFRTKSVNINIAYRDFGQEDGDYIRVLVNDEVVQPRVSLTSFYKGFKIELQEGFNKIEFLALNVGYVSPNTAELNVVDNAGNIIASKHWYLSTGYKATIIVVKE